VTQNIILNIVNDIDFYQKLNIVFN